MLVTCAPDVFINRKYLFGFSKCVCKDAQEIQQVLHRNFQVKIESVNQGMSHFICPTGQAQVSLKMVDMCLVIKKACLVCLFKWS